MIATFDNDGTLWVEQPLAPQFDFVFRKWAEEIKQDPSLAAKQPPCLARKMSAGRLVAVEFAGAAVLGWGAQLDQSNLPGTCASSSTR